MPLPAGTRLGPYEILAPLGAGGMGEVYRGRALKLLPDAVSRDPERLARFEREAKVLAALNHPNIAQIKRSGLSGNHGAKTSARKVLVRGGTSPRWRPFPAPASGQGGKWQISKGENGPPIRPRNDRELFYAAGDNIMAVSYTVKGDVFLADPPRVWLAKAPRGNFDVSPDGKRLLVPLPVETGDAPKAAHEFVSLENFFDELRRRVPLGR
jgi:serine/threonine protein kinase